MMNKNNATLLLNPKLTDTILATHTFKPLLHKDIYLGLGECMVNNCHCRAFEGNDPTCTNCGHNKERHW